MTVDLRLGDCVEILKTLQDNSVDSVVTDPPAGISFMSKKWDEDKGGRKLWIAWMTLVMSECIRILKPGGHAIVWAIPRTSHWTATAIEDSGFEIRDIIVHIFGCLSDDTELLTSDGWVRYNTVNETQHALAFDCTSGQLRWEPITTIFQYYHVGEMVRLKSSDTDQLITANHRVVLEERQAPHAPYIPSEQALQCLLENVRSARPISVASNEGMLRGMPHDFAEGSTKTEVNVRANGNNPTNLLMRQEVLETANVGRQGTSLLKTLQWQGARAESGQILKQRIGKEASRERPIRTVESGVEGRRYHIQEAWELCRGEIRESTEFGNSNGPQGWVSDGASVTDSSSVRLSTHANGSSQSREPRSDRQPTGEFDALADESGSQVIRMGQVPGGYILPSTAVTASRVEYAGVVWCIGVPSGAFVARRNGQIFVTGNSGFPKSLDVSKAIDKSYNLDRKVIGPHPTNACAGGNWCNCNTDGRSFSPTKHSALTEPASGEARHWHGWGTSLKPAAEHWILARKPLIDTVASNVLKYGTGAINIDSCRISASGRPKIIVSPMRDDVEYHGNSLAGRLDGTLQSSKSDGSTDLGRWPANVVLSHSENCKQVGKSKVKARVINTFDDGAKPFGGGAGHEYLSESFGDEDGMETIEVYECESDCAVRLLNEQAGVTTSGAMKHEVPAYNGESVTGFLRGTSGPSNQHEDTGGVSRYFATFQVDSNDSFMYNEQQWNDAANNAEYPSGPSHTMSGEDLVDFAQEPVPTPKSRLEKNTPGDHSTRNKDDGIESGENQEVEKFIANTNIDGSGRKPIGSSQPGVKYTTSTSTKPTTNYQTSPVSQLHGTMNTMPDSERTTELMTESKNDVASNVINSSHLITSRLEQAELIKDTASNVNKNISENGEIKTENITTPICEHITPKPEEPGPPELQTSRFFYTSKSSTWERSAGLEGMPETGNSIPQMRALKNKQCKECDCRSIIAGSTELSCEHGNSNFDWVDGNNEGHKGSNSNPHPTVKNLSLMRWLVRMVTRVGGTVLDPFAGSGSTGCAAVIEGMNFIGIEQSSEYISIAEKRINYWKNHQAPYVIAPSLERQIKPGQVVEVKPRRGKKADPDQGSLW